MGEHSVEEKLRWVVSNDLRFIPPELVSSSRNKELDVNEFYMMAQYLVDTRSELVFAFIGANDEHQIKNVVLAVFDLTDKCIYLNNMWGVSLKDEAFLNAVREQKKKWNAKAVKLQRTKIMEI